MQGSPEMMRQIDCMYVFEWPTPLVCPETVIAQGCKLKVSQLQYTFDLSRLSGDVQVAAHVVCVHIHAENCSWGQILLFLI